MFCFCCFSFNTNKIELVFLLLSVWPKIIYTPTNPPHPSPPSPPPTNQFSEIIFLSCFLCQLCGRLKMSSIIPPQDAPPSPRTLGTSFFSHWQYLLNYLLGQHIISLIVFAHLAYIFGLFHLIIDFIQISNANFGWRRVCSTPISDWFGNVSSSVILLTFIKFS